MSHIVVISSYPLFPLMGGNRVRTFSLIKSMKNLGHTITFIYLKPRKKEEIDLIYHQKYFNGQFLVLNRNFMYELIYLTKRYLYKILRKLTKKNHLQSSVDEIFFNNHSKKLKQFEKENNCDYVMVNYVHFSKSLLSFPNSIKIIDTHDSFENQMPEREESLGFLRADYLIAIQEQERKKFIKQLIKLGVAKSKTNVLTISHIIDKVEKIAQQDHFGASFIGSYFRQNNESINWFILRVLPLVVNKYPDFKIYISGSVCNAVKEDKNVVLLGRVEEVIDAFKQAPILINPIIYGTGIKIKLLEAWGLGLPVVSTQLGVKGIDQEFLAGTYVVEDLDPASFANALIKLCEDSAVRENFSQINFNNSEKWNNIQESTIQFLLNQ